MAGEAGWVFAGFISAAVADGGEEGLERVGVEHGAAYSPDNWDAAQGFLAGWRSWFDCYDYGFAECSFDVLGGFRVVGLAREAMQQITHDEATEGRSATVTLMIGSSCIISSSHCHGSSSIAVFTIAR